MSVLWTLVKVSTSPSKLLTTETFPNMKKSRKPHKSLLLYFRWYKLQYIKTVLIRFLTGINFRKLAIPQFKYDSLCHADYLMTFYFVTALLSILERLTKKKSSFTLIIKQTGVILNFSSVNKTNNSFRKQLLDWDPVGLSRPRFIQLEE